MKEELGQILAPYRGHSEATLAALKKIQERFGYLPEEAVNEAAQVLGLDKNTLYGVATFYEHFHLHPQGKTKITLCRGTVCYLLGCEEILQELKRQLGIGLGETTADGRFVLEEIRCLGLCEAAPLLQMDEQAFKYLRPEKVKAVLSQHSAQEKPGGRGASEKGNGGKGKR